MQVRESMNWTATERAPVAGSFQLDFEYSTPQSKVKARIEPQSALFHWRPHAFLR